MSERERHKQSNSCLFAVSIGITMFQFLFVVQFEIVVILMQYRKKIMVCFDVGIGTSNGRTTEAARSREKVSIVYKQSMTTCSLT